jgi:hypothetical protein
MGDYHPLAVPCSSRATSATRAPQGEAFDLKAAHVAALSQGSLGLDGLMAALAVLCRARPWKISASGPEWPCEGRPARSGDDFPGVSLEGPQLQVHRGALSSAWGWP